MKKKSLLVITLIIIMVFGSFMVACGSGDEPVADTEQQTAAQETGKAEVVSADAASEAAEEATEVTAEKTEATDTTKTTEAAKTTEATKVKSSTDKKSDVGTSTKESAKQPTKSNTNATKATEAKKVCYITVDGYCSDKQIELKGGESVYDILKKTGASVSARNTGYGVYVEGINGRFEFDEGPTSGWVYTVNGSRVNVSCSSCDVKNGDKIVWKYVTE